MSKRGPLDKLVQPFLLLSSFTPFFKGKQFFYMKGKILEGGKFSGEENFGGDMLLAGIAGKNEVQKNVIKKIWGK